MWFVRHQIAMPYPSAAPSGAGLAQIMDTAGSLASASRYATTSAAVQLFFVPKTPTKRARSSPLVTIGGSDPESRSCASPTVARSALHRHFRPKVSSRLPPFRT